MTTKTNKAYKNLLSNNNGLFKAYSDYSRTIGININTAGEKKATTVRMLLPFVTSNGNYIPTDVTLSGAQARSLYEALKSFYEQNDKST